MRHGGRGADAVQIAAEPVADHPPHPVPTGACDPGTLPALHPDRCLADVLHPVHAGVTSAVPLDVKTSIEIMATISEGLENEGDSLPHEWVHVMVSSSRLMFRAVFVAVLKYFTLTV